MPQDVQKVGIAYGVMSPKISQQLKEQGLSFDKLKVDNIEKLRDAFNRIRISGLLTPKEADNVNKKLHDKLIKHLNDYVIS